MSLPKTVWYCSVNKTIKDMESRCSLGAAHLNPKCQALTVAGPDDLVIRREADGSWPDWVLDGLGWELDDSHDLSAVMDGVWRERPRAAAEGEETDADR